MTEINEHVEIIRDDNNSILEDIQEDINRLCEEVAKQQKKGTDINPNFAEYILRTLREKNIFLEDIVKKIKFVSSQIKLEFEKDIKQEFGEYLIGILNNINGKIPPSFLKKNSWDLTQEQKGKVNDERVLKRLKRQESADNINPPKGVIK